MRWCSGKHASGQQEALEVFKVLTETLDSQLSPMLATMAACGSGSSAICESARNLTFIFWRHNCKQLMSKAASHGQSSGCPMPPSTAQHSASEHDILVQVWLC